MWSRIGLNPQQYQGQRVFRGKGCDHCLHTGYRGRRGIFELLPMSPAMKSLVLTTADANEIRQQAMAEGMVSLAEDGADKVLQGQTTIEEVYRVCRQG
jgi:type II secretory ATPase GspE/PulE/Tfp pilus assembly ATPase PilB-like protein